MGGLYSCVATLLTLTGYLNPKEQFAPAPCWLMIGLPSSTCGMVTEGFEPCFKHIRANYQNPFPPHLKHCTYNYHPARNHGVVRPRGGFYINLGPFMGCFTMWHPAKLGYPYPNVFHYWLVTKIPIQMDQLRGMHQSHRSGLHRSIIFPRGLVFVKTPRIFKRASGH